MKTNVVMSMVNPSTDALMTKVESRYGLVVLAARRARLLMTGAEAKAKNKSTKSVTNALEEIAEGKITYEIAKDFPEEPEEGMEEDYFDEEEESLNGRIGYMAAAAEPKEPEKNPAAEAPEPADEGE